MSDNLRSGHTPGPWEMILDDTGKGRTAGLPMSVNTVAIYDDPDPKTIVGCSTGLVPHEWCVKMEDTEIIANGILIAHAPTMYDYIEAKAREGDPMAQKIIMSICRPSDYLEVSFSGAVE